MPWATQSDSGRAASTTFKKASYLGQRSRILVTQRPYMLGGGVSWTAQPDLVAQNPVIVRGEGVLGSSI